MIHRIVCIILLCISALGLQAQTLTPEVLFDNYRDAPFVRMASNASNVIIAVQNHTTLIRSSDNGKSWHRAKWNRHYTGSAISFLDSNHCITSDKDTNWKFVCFYSDDAGLTWSESTIIYPDSNSGIEYFSRLIPMNNGVCIAINDKKQVYITTDYGKKWSYRSTLNFSAYKFVRQGNSIIAIGDSSFYKSIDSGLVWSEVAQFPVKGNCVYHNARQDTINVFIRDSAKHMYRVISTDAGETYHINHNYNYLPDYYNIISYQPEKTFIVKLGNERILLSTDGCLTWDTISTKDQTMSVYSTLMLNDTTLIVGGYNKGLFSIDLSRKIVEKISYTRLWGVNFSQIQKDFSVLSDYQANLFVSTDDGAIWNQWEKPQLTELSDFYFFSREKALAIGHGEKNGLFITKNGGKTWSDISLQLGESYSGGKISFIDSLTGVVSVRNKENKNFLLSTTDGCSTWITSPLDTNVLLVTLVCNKINNSNLTVVAGAFNKTELRTPIYISDNYGIAWKQVYLPDTITVQSIKIVDNGIMYVYVKKVHTNNSATCLLYRTTDSGKTWEKVLKDKEVVGMIWGWGAMSAQKNLVTIVYPYSDSIIISNDYGNTWKQFRFYSYPINFHVKLVTSQLTLQNDTLYITGETTDPGSPPVTGGPRTFLLRFVLPEEMTTSVERKTIDNDKCYTNVSVTPNPADETVSVHLQLSPQELRTTTLILYSEQGILIRDLTSELMKSGTYCSIETNTLSSGIYFLTIRSNTFSQTVPMVVLH